MRDSASFALLVLVFNSAVAMAAGLPFPGTDVARSPDRKWELRSKPPTNGDEHKLNLANVETRSIMTVLSFRRHVDVLWAPDSVRVAVTDYAGSDTSDCKIVDVRGGGMISIREALGGSMLAAVVNGNHHAFVKCSKWSSPNVIDIEVDAYGDANPKGVRKRAQFDIAQAALVAR
jgi:hypothetical protein